MEGDKDNPYNPEKRILGPNEQYATWSTLESVTFDRRDKTFSKDALKFINTTNYRLAILKYSKDFFEFLPAEPFFPLLAKIVGTKKQYNFTPEHYAKIRLNLMNSRLLNYKWMNFVKYTGESYSSSPCFLTALGKFYYQAAFKASADTMAKGFYRECVISNRDCSVRHLFHLNRFYDNTGHEVVMGKYPFDMVVDKKHGFILTEMHENSIGMEMRLSEAIFQGLKKGIDLYLPSMTPEHRNRNCGIMGGLLYNYKIPDYCYASYLEPEICSDTKINAWSYFITKRSNGNGGEVFREPLPFPKIHLDSSKIVATQLSKLDKTHGDLTASMVSFQYSLQFVNGLNNKEIIPGIKVTAGFGQIRELWQEMATDSDILITAKIRMTILDNLRKMPKVVVINDSSAVNDDEEMNEEVEGDALKNEREVYRALKRKNVKVIPLKRNHAKAILNKYRLMIHSMPTTYYMGNNRESFGIIDFSEHPERDEIHSILHEMLIAFGNDNPHGFIKGLKLIRGYFWDMIELHGHFSGKKTIEWPYFVKLVSRGKKRDYTIMTSHLDFKNLARQAKMIRIQGVSRFANHNSLMNANCSVIKERLWHPRMLYNKDMVALGSWDFAQIEDQKELQMIINMNPKKRKSLVNSQ